MIARFWQTLMRLWQRRRYEQDLQAELEFHWQCRVDDLLAQGLTRSDAERQARLELGMLEIHRDDVRAAHGLAFADRWWGDLCRAARGLAATPWFALSAAVVLGLAIGINLILHGLWQNYLATPPALSREGQLFDLDLRGAAGRFVPPLSGVEIETLKEQLQAVDVAVVYSHQSNQILQSAPPRMIYGASVGPDYFRLLRHQMLQGRSFVAADFAASAPVALISARLWHRLPEAPQRLPVSLQLGGQRFQVIGVVADDFAGLEPFPPQFFLTDHQEASLLQAQGKTEPPRFATSLLLPPGLDPESVRSMLRGWLAALPRNQLIDERVAEVQLLPRTAQLSAAESRDAGAFLTPIVLFTLLLLIAACANVGNLMLARVSLRQQELAVRASLGATRWQLIRLLMLESLLLALMAGAIGVLFTSLALDPIHRYGMSMLVAIGIEPLPMHVDWSLLPWMLLQALVACLGFGLLPALCLTTGDLAQASRRDSGLWQGRIPAARLRGWLMSAQVAVSLVLLVTAALIIDLTRKSRDLQIGYPIEQLVDLRHPAPDQALRTRIAAVPGVLATASTGNSPLYGFVPRQLVQVDGRSLQLGIQQIDPEYLSALSLPILLGRNFTEAEATQEQPVALISARTADLLWPGQSPLDRQVTLLDTDANGLETRRQVSIIGVVPSVVSGLPVSGVDASMIYLPGALGQPAMRDLLVRVDARAGDALLAALAEACSAGPQAQLCQPWRLSDMVSVYRLPMVVASHLAAGLGLLSLLISGFGLFGVIRFQVHARWREFGIRMALGAAPRSVISLVLWQALRQLRAGLVIGLLLCLGLSAVLSSMLGVGRAFPMLAYLGVPMLLMLMALASASWPAWRATRLSALDALREQ